MNHPNRDEWIPLLFDEADFEAKHRLEQHLQECPACARDVAAWRHTLHRLDAWTVEEAPMARPAIPRHVIAWAAAAAFVIAAFIAGQVTARSNEARLRATLQAEFAAQLDQRFARASAQSAEALDDLQARLLVASARGAKDLAADFAQALANIRSDDRRALDALYQRIQEQHASDFVALRRDLETLASATDDELQHARMKLIQVAAATQQESQP